MGQGHHREPRGSGMPQGATWVRDTTRSHVGQGHHREPRWSGTPQGATWVRDTTRSHVGQGHHKEQPRGSGTPQGTTWVRDTTRSHVHHTGPRGSARANELRRGQLFWTIHTPAWPGQVYCCHTHYRPPCATTRHNNKLITMEGIHPGPIHLDGPRPSPTKTTACLWVNGGTRIRHLIVIG